MARLILIVVLVVIILAILQRRKQPPPPLVEIHPPLAKDEAPPALRGDDEGQDVADLPSQHGDSISEKEEDS